jgi:hypothetical protein
MGEVGDGASVSDCVIGAEGVVGAGESCIGERIPSSPVP